MSCVIGMGYGVAQGGLGRHLTRSPISLGTSNTLQLTLNWPMFGWGDKASAGKGAELFIGHLHHSTMWARGFAEAGLNCS